MTPIDVRELPTVQQIEVCRRLITELKQGIARARQAAGQAARIRNAAALEATRGNGEARRVLQAATTTTTEAELKAENLEMALSAARERLAQLERQAEAEWLDGIGRRGMEAARVRRAAAERLQAAIEVLVEAYDAFRATDELISAVRGEPDGHRLIPIDWHAAITLTCAAGR